MKRFLGYAAVILATLLPAAHFLRLHGPGPAAAWLVLPPLLLTRQAWARRVYELALACGFVVLLDASVGLVRVRQAMHLPFLRLAAIMAAVTLLVGLAVLLLESRTFKARLSAGAARAWPACAAFGLAFLGLAAVQLKVRMPMLLLERFVPGAGWLEIGLLSCYAAWVTEQMLDPERAPKVRGRIWTLFSAVFFAQLALGLSGLDVFLMTGTLHLPVPALIVAGPIFRGEGLFMPILFVSTVLLVGPAWCSHLCYIGAWDHLNASRRARPKPLPAWTRTVRWAVAGLVPAAALALRLLGAPVPLAVGLAAAFGLAGVAVMLLVSRRTGTMAHCSAFCPIGVVAGLAGRLSPWRMAMDDRCTRCGRCAAACRYGALTRADIEAGRPNIACTLCGDCVPACPRSDIGYTFLGRKHPAARTAFVVLVVALHALFLGVARI